MQYIGIDPGKSGGIAVMYEDSTVSCCRKMPSTERDIWELIDWISNEDCKAIIEKVHSMPGQGVKSMFTFGQGYGFLRGCLIAAEIPFEEVTPRIWQKALGIRTRHKGEEQTAWKNHLKSVAQQKFPGLNITLNTADAILIAEYNRRKNQ